MAWQYLAGVSMADHMKQIVKAAEVARKAASDAAAKAAELDALAAVYWKVSGDSAPLPWWFAQAMRQQAEALAGMAHSMEMWAKHAAALGVPEVPHGND